jgi:hypothetical protein
MTAFKVPLVDTALTMGPRSTDAVRKLTESSWPSLKKKNQMAVMAITAAIAMIVLARKPISSVFNKQPPP